MTIAYPIAGIDIGKDTLDIAILNEGGRCEAFSFANEKASREKLARRLNMKGVTLVVLEATGGYEVPVMAVLAAAGLPFSRVNPGRVRDFAKGLGVLAKTDRLDARCLALFGERMRPAPTAMPSENESRLNALTLRRRQLVDARQKERNRRHRAGEPAAKASIERTIAFLGEEIALIDAAIEELIAATPDFAERRDLVDSVPGIAAATANTVVASLPELGRIPTRKLKKLVGVAPLNHDSAMRQGARRIAGGRAVVRQALYMAAQTGYRHNPALAALYQRLRAKGRSHKSAIIACIGKMLSILNAIIRTRTPFDPRFAMS
jgi:transposase